MDDTYIVKNEKIISLLNEIDNFLTKMKKFNNKYNNIYKVYINIFSEKDIKNKNNKIYVAKVNLERNE